jgi:hypothetical protein
MVFLRRRVFAPFLFQHIGVRLVKLFGRVEPYTNVRVST